MNKLNAMFLMCALIGACIMSAYEDWGRMAFFLSITVIDLLLTIVNLLNTKPIVAIYNQGTDICVVGEGEEER
jgi:hypothetical protein